MKTIFTLLLGILGGAISSGQAQSWIEFRNFAGLKTLNVPFFDDQGRLLKGTKYLVQCYAAPHPEQMVPWGLPVDFTVPSIPGYFASRSFLIYNIRPGAYGWVQARAWEAAGGATFEEAARNGFWTGTSAPLQMRTGDPAADPPEVPPPMIGLRYPGSPMFFDPPDNQSIRAGESATLTVVPRGDLELFYQWYGGTRGDTSQPIAGATQADFTTPVLSASTSYWVKVYYSLGTTNIARVGANVTVYPTSSVWLELSLSSGEPVITIKGVAGQRYRLESSPELGTAAVWTPTTELTLPSSSFTYTDTNPVPGPRRFYRAVALAP